MTLGKNDSGTFDFGARDFGILEHWMYVTLGVCNFKIMQILELGVSETLGAGNLGSFEF